MVCDVGRALLAAECAVEIGADAAVPRVAGDLADAIDVIDHRIERDARAFRRRLSAHPPGHEHPGVERGADHRVRDR